MTTAIRCMISDLGNVIALLDHQIACRNLAGMSEGGLTAQQVYDLVFQSGLEARYDRGEMSTAEFLSELARMLEISADRQRIADAWADIFWPNEAVIALLADLRASGYRLVLASNTNELHIEWIHRRFPRMLSPFDRLVLSHEVGCRKPDRRFFELCLEAAGCAPGECVYVDDREDFVAQGTALGIHSICYAPSVDLHARLTALGVNQRGFPGES